MKNATIPFIVWKLSIVYYTLLFSTLDTYNIINLSYIPLYSENVLKKTRYSGVRIRNNFFNIRNKLSLELSYH